MHYASFWRRFVAYLLDVLPITLVVLLLFIAFLDFGNTAQTYFSNPSSSSARLAFLLERNSIRDLSFLIWILLGAALEGSIWQGTPGKKLLGLQVVDLEGRRIMLPRAIARNLLKVVSLVPFGLGFIWAGFTKDRRTWHDWIAKTRVVVRSSQEAAQVAA